MIKEISVFNFVLGSIPSGLWIWENFFFILFTGTIRHTGTIPFGFLLKDHYVFAIDFLKELYSPLQTFFGIQGIVFGL